MKATKTIISTLREAPNDAVIASHQLMMRSGLIRKLGNGLYAYMPFGFRSLMKVEKIIREELDNAGLLEIKPTVIVPGDLWKESGRWDKMSGEMLTAQNRQGQDMVVSPTAEEAFTALVREGLSSYKQLPFTLYQINTKYRDEIRPRYGVMRGREFTMMDAYSFDKDQADLDASYDNVAEAYRRIFKRMGLTTISVKADTGSMGGSGSEEFMVESEVGDDTLLLCPDCSYAANVEKAACKKEVPLDSNGQPQKKTDKAIEEVATPNVFSIEDMEKFFGEKSTTFLKALIYKVYNCAVDLSQTEFYKGAKTVTEGGQTYIPETFFCVLIRGDLDVNETKLAAVLKASGAELASDEDVLKYSGAPHGFVGPVGIKIPVLMDESTVDMHDCIAGAGKEGYHIKHVEPGRDFTAFMTADVRTCKEGDACPECGGKFYMKKGNELGHIFKLGTKYTKSMNVTYLGESGKPVTPLMGCYGIGVDRTLASIIEGHHDDKGIIWPMTVAPYQVAVIPVQYKDKMKEVADKIYEDLKSDGIEVILDDRNERPGVKFTDSELIGYPIRIVVGDKNLPNVELKLRQDAEATLVPAEEAAAKAAEIVRDELKKLNA
ncbi:proline--tRNA ligase [Treponema sp.]|uniref:proline--tRNA ligase n=1 Tax=Treponema sp. TaxID=166 RepID=UPI00298E2794|nr:proline--tRNA ligase [Treponema sp.]MCR5612754.1 proline--tRNA ligase [Treponema sp.]